MPYIDVMLVLLVIFMITAPLLTQGVKVELPRAAAEPIARTETEPLVISMDERGDYYINYGENQGEPVEPEILVARVSALIRHRPGLPVLVRGDRNVPYGDIVVLMSLLQGAGVPSVGLITEPQHSG